MSGLFTAAFLRRIGWDVDVFERSPVELVGRGAGITTHPELLEALEQSGAGTRDLGIEVPKRITIDRQGRLISCEQGNRRVTRTEPDGSITVLADVPNGSEIAQNEVFGPVLVVTPFDTEEEAIALANGTDYGLGAYVHTQNLRRAHHVTAQLQAGQIHVNGSGEAMQPNVPFGGFKQSGHGRLGGEEGLHEFLQPKNIWMNLAAEG